MLRWIIGIKSLCVSLPSDDRDNEDPSFYFVDNPVPFVLMYVAFSLLFGRGVFVTVCTFRIGFLVSLCAGSSRVSSVFMTLDYWGYIVDWYHVRDSVFID